MQWPVSWELLQTNKEPQTLLTTRAAEGVVGKARWGRGGAGGTAVGRGQSARGGKVGGKIDI